MTIMKRFPTADERWPRQGIVMTKEEEDRNANIIRLADGTIKPLETSVKVGYKDAPKIVVDPKKAKVTRTILRFPFEREYEK